MNNYGIYMKRIQPHKVIHNSLYKNSRNVWQWQCLVKWSGLRLYQKHFLSQCSIHIDNYVPLTITVKFSDDIVSSKPVISAKQMYSPMWRLSSGINVMILVYRDPLLARLDSTIRGDSDNNELPIQVMVTLHQVPKMLILIHEPTQ